MIKETFKDNLNIWETFLHFNFTGGLQQIGVASHCSRKCAFLICKKKHFKNVCHRFHCSGVDVTRMQLY